MTNSKTIRNLASLLVLAAGFSFAFAETANAFTQVETQFLPPVQLVTSQSAQVSVVNFSNVPVTVMINIFNSAGVVAITKTVTVAASKTFGIRFQNGKTTTSYSATVSASVASSVVSDFQVLAANGQTIVTSLPILELPAVQHLGSVRLLPGQGAAVAITNVSSVASSFTVQVFDSAGTIVLTHEGTISAAQTLSFPFSNTEKASVGYRAVVSTSAANTLTPNLMTFDVATGHLIAVIPPGPCRVDPY
jgi:hypothetical protein